MGSSSDKSSHAVGSLEIIEEAFHLLRGSSPALFTSYYLGSIPFVLGLLFFWADMSHGVDAAGRLLPAAMGMTLLYILMKCLQSDFTRRLKNRITGAQLQKLSIGKIIRLVVFQSVYQPLGFIVLPVALLITVPFGWAFAFFQNVTVFGLEDGTIGELRRRAWRQAMIWPAQNNLMLGIMFLFSVFIMINIMVAALEIPYLIKTLFGIETVFSRSGIHIMNTTFFVTLAALTYLSIDPVIKAVYVLRCYYGEARKTGEDLDVELRIAKVEREKALSAILIVVCLFLTGITVPASAATDAGGAEVKTGVNADQLKKAVPEVLKRVEYTWRMPRDRSEELPPSGFWYEFISSIRRWTKAAADWVGKVLKWIADMLRKLLPSRLPVEKGPSGWTGSGYAMIYFLIALGSCTAAILIYRLVGKRKANRGKQETGSPVLTAADLEDENIRADALPEEEWMAMARDLLEGGETRLAVRAFYLAALAHLASAGLIAVADYKSDREYEREIQGRGPSVENTASAFSRIRDAFEIVWYGMRDVSPNGLDFFMENHRRVMGHAVR